MSASGRQVARLALCWAVLGVSATEAQVASARLMGVVRDATGAPLAGAVVTVTAERTGVKETVTTTGEGFYVAPNLRRPNSAASTAGSST